MGRATGGRRTSTGWPERWGPRPASACSGVTPQRIVVDGTQGRRGGLPTAARTVLGVPARRVLSDGAVWGGAEARDPLLSPNGESIAFVKVDYPRVHKEGVVAREARGLVMLAS